MEVITGHQAACTYVRGLADVALNPFIISTNNGHVYKVTAHRKFATQRRSHTLHTHRMDSVSAINSSSQQASQWSSVTEFYTDRDIFVTGGTGFMGKCLLEKLLRSIPGEGKIFVLVRQKKGKSVQERVEELTNSKVSAGILESPCKTLHINAFD